MKTTMPPALPGRLGGHIMRKQMLVFIMGVALVAMGGLTASAASAEVFELRSEECNGAVWNLCWAETEAGALRELQGTQSITAEGGKNLFVVPGIPVEIECEKVKSEPGGTIQQPEPLVKTGTILGLLVFEGCKLVGTNATATKCVIPTKEVTKELSGELTSATNVLLKPEEGEVFIEITFTSKEGQTCPATVIGKRKITGMEDVTILNPQHTLNSKTGESVVKSELLFIEKAAELTGQITVTLTGFEDWFDVTLA
jgi:uncharacterized protein YbcI